jgi:hypothetical protein
MRIKVRMNVELIDATIVATAVKNIAIKPGC